MLSKTPRGCLSPVNEDYYRKHSVPPSSTPGSSSSSSPNRNSSARGFPDTNANSNSRSNRPFSRPDLDPDRRQRPQEVPYNTYTPRAAPNTPRSRTTSTPTNPGTTRPTSGQPNISRPTSSAGRQSTPRSTSPAHGSSHPVSPPPLPPPMSTLVTLPRSSLSALSVGALKRILWEARVRVPPGVVEKEELVERVWAIIEEEKRKDDEGLEDFGFDMDEAEMETVGLESEAQPNVAHEHGQGNHHHHANVDVVGGHSEMAHEDYLFVPAMDSGLSRSRPTTPQLSTSPPKRQTSPSGSKPHPKPTSAERSGLCVVCQDEEACIAIVDCGCFISCFVHNIFRLTCLFLATSHCVVNALILFSRVLESALYVARGLLRRLDYLGYLRLKMTVNLCIVPPVFL